MASHPGSAVLLQVSLRHRPVPRDPLEAFVTRLASGLLTMGARAAGAGGPVPPAAGRIVAEAPGVPGAPPWWGTDEDDRRRPASRGDVPWGKCSQRGRARHARGARREIRRRGTIGPLGGRSSLAAVAGNVRPPLHGVKGPAHEGLHSARGRSAGIGRTCQGAATACSGSASGARARAPPAPRPAPPGGGALGGRQSPQLRSQARAATPPAGRRSGASACRPNRA